MTQDRFQAEVMDELRMKEERMTKDEALKMAIEALDSCDINIGYNGDSQYYDEKLVEKAINACKEALEQPAQEPVAWIIQSEKMD